MSVVNMFEGGKGLRIRMSLCVMTKNQSNFVSLLKYIMCFTVALGHFYGIYYGSAALKGSFTVGEILFKYGPTRLFIDGRFMVFIFAVISGMLMTKKDKQNYDIAMLSKDILYRYLRFALPLLYTYIFCYFMYRYIGNDSGEIANRLNNSWILNLSGTFSGSDYFFEAIKVSLFGGAKIIPVMWSMPYFFWGGVLIYINRFIKFRVNKNTYIIICTIELITLFFVCSLIFAILAGSLVMNQNMRKRIISQRKKILCILCIILFQEYVVYLIKLKSHLIGDYATAISATCLVSLLLGLDIKIEKNINILKSSFEVYLLHWPILMALSWKIFLWLSNITNFTIHFFTACIITMGIILISAFSLYYIDSLTLKKIKRIFYNRDTKPREQSFG